MGEKPNSDYYAGTLSDVLPLAAANMVAAGHADIADVLRRCDRALTALSRELVRAPAGTQEPETEPDIPADWLWDRLPWISGRLFVPDHETLVGLFREVVDAVATRGKHDGVPPTRPTQETEPHQPCVVCGKPVDTREVEGGGGREGASLDNGRLWACCAEHWERAARMFEEPEEEEQQRYFRESYADLRDAVEKHLGDCIIEDDVAEIAILVEAIETAGARLRAPEPTEGQETEDESWMGCDSGDCPHETRAECDAFKAGFRLGSAPVGNEDWLVSREWIAKKGSEILALGIRLLRKPVTKDEALRLTALGSVLSGAHRTWTEIGEAADRQLAAEEREEDDASTLQVHGEQGGRDAGDAGTVRRAEGPDAHAVRPGGPGGHEVLDGDPVGDAGDGDLESEPGRVLRGGEDVLRGHHPGGVGEANVGPRSSLGSLQVGREEREPTAGEIRQRGQALADAVHALRAPEPVGETEIRTDDDGVDEIVGTGAFHMERLDDDVWWFSLSVPGRERLAWTICGTRCTVTEFGGVDLAEDVLLRLSTSVGETEGEREAHGERLLRRVGAQIAAVFVFPNDMVAVTDHDGQQIPALQGHRDECLPVVQAAARGREHEIEWNGWLPPRLSTPKEGETE